MADAAPAGAFDRASIALRIGGLALLPDSIGGSTKAVSFAAPALTVSLGLHLLMLLGEVAMPHTTDNARYAARLMTHGPFARAFWGGAVVMGGVIPLLLLLVAALLFASPNRIAAGVGQCAGSGRAFDF